MATQAEYEAFKDQQFMENVRDARENGFERVCADCGWGFTGETDTPHDDTCPQNPEYERNMQFIQEWAAARKLES